MSAGRRRVHRSRRLVVDASAGSSSSAAAASYDDDDDDVCRRRFFLTTRAARGGPALATTRRLLRQRSKSGISTSSIAKVRARLDSTRLDAPRRAAPALNFVVVAPGVPFLLRSIRLQKAEAPVPVSALRCVDDLSQIAIGLCNGQVVVIRGTDVSRDRFVRVRVRAPTSLCARAQRRAAQLSEAENPDGPVGPSGSAAPATRIRIAHERKRAASIRRR